MKTRRREQLHGIVALVALLVILAGPPLLLARVVGWPLPTRIPSLDELNIGARSGIDPRTLVKVLATLGWLCWLELALAAAAEFVALVLRRAPRRVPAPTAIRVGMGKLVAAAALLAAGITVPKPHAIPAARLAAAVTGSATTAPDIAAPPTSVIATPAASPPTPPASAYVVQRNDSWWEIAERTLGDGQRWRELRDSNVGRTMADGTTITTATELIRPGWELVVPRDATIHETPPPAASSNATTVTVARGDNLWDLAARHLRDVTGTPTTDEIRAYWLDTIDANRARFANPTNPSLVFAGQVLELPAIGEPPPSPPQQHSEPSAAPHIADPDAKPAPPTTTDVRNLARHDTPDRDIKHADRDGASSADSQPSDVGVLGAASGVLALGLTAAVAQRRRRRLLHLPPGVQPPSPRARFDGLRAEAAASADADRGDLLATALRTAGEHLAELDTDARPTLVQVTGDRVELSLSRAVPTAPLGWSPDASGLVWVCDGPAPSVAADSCCPMPALVSVGRDDAGELYLDLEAAGLVAVHGDHGIDAARSWLLELATSPLAAGISVAVVGDGLIESVDEFDRVRLTSGWNEVTADATAWAEQSTAILAANQRPTPVVARVAGPRPEDIAPLVVFATRAPDPHQVDALRTLIVEQHTAVTIVLVGSHLDGALEVDVHDGDVHIPRLGLSCRAQLVDQSTATDIDDLLDDAARVPEQLEPLDRPRPRSPATDESVNDQYEDPPYEILVRLLGDISVDGATKPLKPKQLAVLAYIALNGPIGAERVEDALWVAPTSSRHKRLANTVSETRTAIGAAHLPAATDGRYSVGPGVVTDIDLFERRLAYAASQPDELATDTLRGALDLVRGPVFTYRNADRASYVWVDVENWHSTWELHVTNAAEDLARRYLDLDDVDGAIWAARKGLTVARVHPRLTKLLMDAYVAHRDTTAAAQVFESYQSALEQLDLDDVDPDLFDAYQSLRRRDGAAV